MIHPPVLKSSRITGQTGVVKIAEEPIQWQVLVKIDRKFVHDVIKCPSSKNLGQGFLPASSKFQEFN